MVDDASMDDAPLDELPIQQATTPSISFPPPADPTPPAEPTEASVTVALATGSHIDKLRVKLDGSRIVEIAQKAVSIAEADLEAVLAGARSTGVALRIGNSK